jgi:hypothetical protein
MILGKGASRAAQQAAVSLASVTAKLVLEGPPTAGGLAAPLRWAAARGLKVKQICGRGLDESDVGSGASAQSAIHQSY